MAARLNRSNLKPGDGWPTSRLMEACPVPSATLSILWPGTGPGNHRRWATAQRYEIALMIALCGPRVGAKGPGDPYREWVFYELAPAVAAEWCDTRWAWLSFEFPARSFGYSDDLKWVVAGRRSPVSTIVDLATVLGPVAD